MPRSIDLARKRLSSYPINIFIGGPEIANMSISQILAGLPGRLISKNILKPTVDSFEMSAIYSNNNTPIVFAVNYWRDRDNITYLVIDSNSVVSMNNTNGFEFFNTVIDYIYLPKINVLGRQAFQNSKWLKIAYLPEAVDSGRRTFLSVPIGSDLKIYMPKLINFGADTFSFNDSTSGSRFSATKLYLDNSTWGSVDPSSNAVLNSFVGMGGTIVYIMNYDIPSAPSNVFISNITSTTFDISFTASNSNNPIEDYEVFCVKQGDPVSKYFYHQNIINTTATISGLESGTHYKVMVRAADVYYNLSKFSTKIQLTTS